MYTKHSLLFQNNSQENVSGNTSENATENEASLRNSQSQETLTNESPFMTKDHRSQSDHVWSN